MFAVGARARLPRGGVTEWPSGRVAAHFLTYLRTAATRPRTSESVPREGPNAWRQRVHRGRRRGIRRKVDPESP